MLIRTLQRLLRLGTIPFSIEMLICYGWRALSWISGFWILALVQRQTHTRHIWAERPHCHNVEFVPWRLLSPDSHVPRLLGMSLVPSWPWEFWFPSYTCEVPRGCKAMSFGIAGTFLATIPVTIKDTRVTGLQKATDFGTQLPSLRPYHAGWSESCGQPARPLAKRISSVFRKAIFL